MSHRPGKVAVFLALAIMLLGGIAWAQEDPTPEACLQSSLICSGLSVPGSESDPLGTESPSQYVGEQGADSELPPTYWRRIYWDSDEYYDRDDPEHGTETPFKCPEGQRGYEAEEVERATGRVISRTNDCEVPGEAGSGPSASASIPARPTAAEVRNQTPIGDATIVIDPNELGLTGLLARFSTEGVGTVTSESSIRGYTVSAIAEPTSYSWDLGDATYEQGMNPEHVYETKATVMITLTVTYSGSYTWSGNGRSGSGDLGSVQRETRRDYRVIEARGIANAL